MDARDLNAFDLDPDAAPIVHAYLTALRAQLPAGRRLRADILAEVADGLACAVVARIEQGMTARDAAGAAVVGLGHPTTVARAFTGQIALAEAHRVGIGLLASGPVVGLLWLAAFASGPSPLSRIIAFFSALPVYPLILATTVPAAVLAMTGAGWAARHVRLPASLATGAAVTATIGCVLGDASLLSMAIIGGVTGAGAPILATFALLVSGVRLVIAGWSGRRIARLRAAGN
jgi:hypothetical protein